MRVEVRETEEEDSIGRARVRDAIAAGAHGVK